MDREAVRAIVDDAVMSSAPDAVDQATDAILSAMPAPVVEVKELEWAQNSPTDKRSEWVHVELIDRCYTVELDNSGLFEAETIAFPHGDFDTAQPLGRHLTTEAAKAACQADFARRISECTTATTRDEVERETIEALAIRAHANAHDPNWQENLDGCQSLARSDWLEVEAFVRSHKGSAS